MPAQDQRLTYEVIKSEKGLELHTPRLVIRSFRESDIPALIEYLSTDEPMVRRVMKIEPDEEGIRKHWLPMRNKDPFGDPDWLSMLIELKSEARVVGNVGYGITVIDASHKLGCIGWSLSPPYQGQGIAKEAAWAILGLMFDHLGIHRVHARTGEDNAPSWRLMERLGMTREAHFRLSHTNLQGEWADEYIYAILDSEWNAAKRQTV